MFFSSELSGNRCVILGKIRLQDCEQLFHRLRLVPNEYRLFIVRDISD